MGSRFTEKDRKLAIVPGSKISVGLKVFFLFIFFKWPATKKTFNKKQNTEQKKQKKKKKKKKKKGIKKKNKKKKTRVYHNALSQPQLALLI